MKKIIVIIMLISIGISGCVNNEKIEGVLKSNEEVATSEVEELEGDVVKEQEGDKEILTGDERNGREETDELDGKGLLEIFEREELRDESVYVIYQFGNELLIFYEKNRVISYDIKKDAFVEIDQEEGCYTYPRYAKRLSNDLIAIINADKLSLYDQERSEVVERYVFNQEEVKYYDISYSGEQLVYTDRSDDSEDNLYISSLKLSDPEMIVYRDIFETRSRAITPKFSKDDSSIACVIIGPRIGINIGIVQIDNLEMKVIQMKGHLEKRTRIEWLDNERLVYSGDDVIKVIDTKAMKILESIPILGLNHIMPVVSHDGRKIVYVNMEGELTVYEIETKRNTVIMEDVARSAINWSEDGTKLYGISFEDVFKGLPYLINLKNIE
jgi:hypothetical protein